MNEETMETTQNTSDPTSCDPTPSQNAEAAEDARQESEPSNPCSAERSEVDEEDLQEALKDSELSKDSDPTVDPDPGASAQPDTATELERLRNELSALREELAKRDKTNLDLKWLKEQSDDDADVSLKELLADMEKYRDTINKAVTQLAALAKGIEE